MNKSEKPLTTDRIKEIQLSILNQVIDFCEQNDIKYYLTGGTLIGAVRHKGFIPWDDDIDLNMPRRDYNRFFSTFNSFRNDSLIAISVDTDKDYYLANGKVYDSNTILIEDLNQRKEIGVNIDIFPLDDLPGADLERSVFLKEMYLLRTLLSLKQIRISKTRAALKNIVLACSQFILKPVNCYWLLKVINEKSQKYNDKDDCTYIAAVATLIWGNKEIFKKELFTSTVKLEFEGRLMDCPSGYDSVLGQVYGDYMQLPPIEKQISHHSYIAYERV